MLACVEKRGEYGQSKKTLNELEIPYFQNWKKCATTPWTAWSECSNNCGSGQQERRRTLKNTQILVETCGVDLRETKSCQGDCTKSRNRKPGKEKVLPDDYIVRIDTSRLNASDICAITPWSDWSPCSVTCGVGLRERWRMFLRKSKDTRKCGMHLMEKDVCVNAMRSCRDALMQKNFTGRLWAIFHAFPHLDATSCSPLLFKFIVFIPHRYVSMF